MAAASPFTDIVERKVPAYIIYEDAHAIAFLDKNPVCDGHALVIPKAAHRDIYDIPSEALAVVAHAAKCVAELLKERLDCDGVNILHASGRAAQQSVPHFHLHVVPRKEGDGLDMWPKVEHAGGDLENVFLRLRG